MAKGVDNIKRTYLFPLLAPKLTYSRDLKVADSRRKKRSGPGKLLCFENGAQKNREASIVLCGRERARVFDSGFSFCSTTLIFGKLLGLRKLPFLHLLSVNTHITSRVVLERGK